MGGSKTYEAVIVSSVDPTGQGVKQVSFPPSLPSSLSPYLAPSLPTSLTPSLPPSPSLSLCQTGQGLGFRV